MSWFKKIRAFYNKEHINCSDGYIDPFEYHKTFYYIMTAFKVADTQSRMKYTMTNQNLIIILFGTSATTLIIVSLLHGIDIADFSHITEAGAYLIVLIYMLLIISCTKINLPQYRNLLAAMKKDFRFICTKGKKYRGKFFDNQLKTWKMSILACIFTAIIAVGMDLFISLSLLYFMATHTPGDGKKRPLVYPIWIFNVDLSASPIYEVLFWYSNVYTLLYGYNYFFMLQAQIVWVRQITSKADIVIWSIQDLMNDIYPATTRQEKHDFSKLIQGRFRDIIIHHQSMYSLLEDYATVYKKLLLFEQTFCGPLICLTAYCTVEQLEEGIFNASLVLLCGGTIGMYFIPSYLCTFLAIKVRSICDACWDIPFWNADARIMSRMVLIMERSQRPLPLSTYGFQDISMETYAKKMTSAYSYFNMLRQTNL